MRTRYFALVLIVLALVGTCARAATDDPNAPPPTPESVLIRMAWSPTATARGW